MNTISQSFFHRLPEEIIRFIFLKIRRKDVAVCSRVCKLWLDIFSENYYWKHFAIREGFDQKELFQIKTEDLLFVRFAEWMKITIFKTQRTTKDILRPLVLKSNDELKAIYDPLLIDALGGLEELRASPVIKRTTNIDLVDVVAPIMRGFDGKQYFLVFRYRDRRLNKNYYEIWDKLQVHGGFIHWGYSYKRHNKSPTAQAPGCLIEQYRWNVDEIVLDRLKRLTHNKNVGVPSSTYNNLEKIELLEEVDATMEDGRSRVVLF